MKKYNLISIEEISYSSIDTFLKDLEDIENLFILNGDDANEEEKE